jgi:Zn-dependent M32 family carboxypeptidase
MNDSSCRRRLPTPDHSRAARSAVRYAPQAPRAPTAGDTAAALSWLQRRMYTVGATDTADNLSERVTGAAPDPTYFTRYLDDKFSAMYSLAHP